MALIDKLQNITATQDDDYFPVQQQIDALNEAKSHIIDVGTRIERTTGKTLRFLDPLRNTQNLSLSLFEAEVGFYISSVTLPNDLDKYIFFDLGQVNLTELLTNYEIYHGNAIPSFYEGYFLLYDQQVDFYLDNDEYTGVTVRYVKQSDPITDTTENTLLGDDADRNVVYYAAYLLTKADATLPSEQYLAVVNEFINDLR